jgi:hypothetical protein
VSDNSVVINAQIMSEVAGGWYKYSYAGYDPTLDYLFVCDGGIILTGGERYSVGSTGVQGDTAQILADTGELQTNQGAWATATGFATSTELAKVPKSDGGVSWNATALAAINAEVDTALNTAIPGSPTTDSINERIASLDGHVTADYGSDEKAAIDLLDDVVGGLTDIHADVVAVKAETALIVADTGEIQTELADGGRLDLILDTIAVDVAGLDGAAMRGTDGAYTGTPPTKAEIRAEIDSSSTQLAAILADTGELQTNQGNWLTATGFATGSDISNLHNVSVADLMGAVVEGTITLKQAMRVCLAVLAGKSSGGGTATLKFRDTQDLIDRVTATVTTVGNRTTVVLDVS